MEDCPNLKAYMERIGAEQINFRTWQIKEYKGKYFFEKTLIRIATDGTVKVAAAFAPTEDEAKAISKEWRESDVPKSVPANSIKGLNKSTQGSVFYKFYDKEGRITFVQERCVPKAYIPWSYWSDGKWRMMQPDGNVPFYKPEGQEPKERLMVHEGAPAAEAAAKLHKDHPWKKFFSEYEHWGVVGGSLSVTRADYPDIRGRQVTDVIYVCDNDWPGRSILQEFSKHYGGRLRGAVFDKRFKESWDAADELPKTFYHGKRYIGPPFEEFLKPATFATELRTAEAPTGEEADGKKKKGKVTVDMRKTFLEEWVHCVTPEVFVHTEWPSRIYTAKEFNNLIAPYSHSFETAKIMTRDDAGKGVVLKYDPANASGAFSSSEGHFINSYQPPNIEPEKGDVTPFLEFMEQLCPVEGDRYQLMKWCATLIARPEVKMGYGVLLISEMQGVGKGTLGEKILMPLIGQLNCSVPSESEIVNSDYNYWMSHKRLAVVHEIYSGHSWKAYNVLKSVITDKIINVRKKYMADYKIENWVHIFACSNSHRAIKMSMDDRRWLVPEVTEKRQPHKYWKELNDWLIFEGGLRKIRHWAESFGDYVIDGETAPWTSTKEEVVEDAFSDGQKLVLNVLRHIAENHKSEEPVVVLDVDLVKLISNVLYDGRHNDRLEKPSTVRAVAKKAGWWPQKDRVKLKAWPASAFNKAHAIMLDPNDAMKNCKDLAEADVNPLDIFKYYTSNVEKI